MKTQKINHKIKSIIFLVLSMGTISSFLGLLLSFILMKLKIVNSLEFFLNLSEPIQFLSYVFYALLWLVLFLVLRKELG